MALTQGRSQGSHVSLFTLRGFLRIAEQRLTVGDGLPLLIQTYRMNFETSIWRT